MAYKKYKVLKDVSIGGVKHEKGASFHGESNSGHITTALHFEQIAEVKEKAEDPDAAAKAKAEREAADAKAKADADAKAKAEADAAAKGGGAK